MCVYIIIERAQGQGQEYACVREYMCCQGKEGKEKRKKIKSLRGEGEQKGVCFVGLELRSIKGSLDFA